MVNRHRGVIPPRNLGLGEEWGRFVENRLVGLSNELDRTEQSRENMGRTATARDLVLERQISQIDNLLTRLQDNHDRINDSIQVAHGRDFIQGNSWGQAVEIIGRPEWAETAIVIAGMDNFSWDSSPWVGKIELLAAPTSLTAGDIGASKDPAHAQVDAQYSLSFSDPRIYFMEQDDYYLEIQAYATRLSGSTSKYYGYDYGIAVIWS